MFARVLKQMKENIRTRQYVMTIHAEEEKDADHLNIYDIEHCILSGKIVERQKEVETAEWKYRIAGKSCSGVNMELIGKISPTGKLVIITVYIIK